MSKSKKKRLSPQELNNLTGDQQKVLSFLTRFYFDVITTNESGVVRKPSPREFYDFVKSNTNLKRMAKRIT